MFDAVYKSPYELIQLIKSKKVNFAENLTTLLEDADTRHLQKGFGDPVVDNDFAPAMVSNTVQKLDSGTLV